MARGSEVNAITLSRHATANKITGSLAVLSA
jgi:hypothetical protein